MRILITGCAGFIGSSLCESLLADGNEIIGIDNFDPFYDKSIKVRNLESFINQPKFQFVECDILDGDKLNVLFSNNRFDTIIHLAAKAGVRPSILNPVDYEHVNVAGTLNLLQAMRKFKINRMIFASSSSIYGNSENVPWSEEETTLNPISPYASSKLSCEKYLSIYAKLYKFQITILRFFTVYGPRQRPDLAIHKFFDLLYKGKPIPFFGDGSTGRDYTFISDTVSGIKGSILKIPVEGMVNVFNLGNSSPVSLNELVNTIEQVTQKKFVLERLPMQAGDVDITYANISKAREQLNYNPSVTLQEGLSQFNDWFKKVNAIK